MTNLDIKLPTRCISYYASDKSAVDGKHSYEFWMRSKLTRICSDRPFSRGDVIEIQSIEENNSGTVINVKVVDEWQQEYPVLNFISGRLIYNKWCAFEYTASEGIQILKPIEQILSDNYSIGFIVLAYKSGKISCIDKMDNNNRFDVYINLSWE